MITPESETMKLMPNKTPLTTDFARAKQKTLKTHITLHSDIIFQHHSPQKSLAPCPPSESLVQIPHGSSIRRWLTIMICSTYPAGTLPFMSMSLLAIQTSVSIISFPHGLPQLHKNGTCSVSSSSCLCASSRQLKK